MPLRARVGRHSRTGAQCQNWKGDQLTVIGLLNRIPVADGGAGGSLGGKAVAGLASNELYRAILRFQKQHFAGHETGFIEPGGTMLARMETLASRPPPAPKPPGQWDAIKTPSVMNAVRRGLADDLELSHAEVVNIVRSTLSDGVITADEVNDLKEVARVSKSIAPRSRKMLDGLVGKIQGGAYGPYRLATDRQKFAAEMACAFLERSGASAFPRLDREDVGVGLLMRIANPGVLNQGPASLCGPAAMLFGVAADNPGAYARYAIDLFEKGTASIARLEIKPGDDVRNYNPPARMDQVDWMTMASLRDSENFLLDYDDAKKQFAGITTPGGLADWFRRAGYSDVQEETNLEFHKGSGTLDDANKLFDKGYRICLFIRAEMLTEAEQSQSGSILDAHWVVQRSRIDVAAGKVRLKVSTWGEGEYQIPHGSKDLSLGDFLDNFYGYVAARP